jgi:hypothetical protein
LVKQASYYHPCLDHHILNRVYVVFQGEKGEQFLEIIEEFDDGQHMPTFKQKAIGATTNVESAIKAMPDRQIVSDPDEDAMFVRTNNTNNNDNDDTAVVCSGYSHRTMSKDSSLRTLAS